MKSQLAKTVGFAVGRTALTLKKYSPEILLGVGIAGFLGSLFFTAKASTKVADLTKKSKQSIAEVREKRLAEGLTEYPEQAYYKDLAMVYGKIGLEYGKLYAPALTLAGTSLACILASHGINTKRNAALMAGYNVVATAFAEYRARVVDELGEEKERELRYGLDEKTEKVVVLDDQGNKVKQKNKILVKDGSKRALSPYARFFDEYSKYYKRDAAANMFFLRSQQAWANDKLIQQGHLFLNEVYDMLGLPRTQEGSVVGWIRKTKSGDGFVDFGLYTVNQVSANEEFVNGYERSVLLDFNVDGVIWNLI